jgi:hypothetical protein
MVTSGSGLGSEIYNQITHNNIANCEWGIQISTVMNSEISYNSITNCSAHGIYGGNTAINSNNIFEANSITLCGTGISMMGGSFNTYVENKISNCSTGLLVQANGTENQIIRNKIVNCIIACTLSAWQSEANTNAVIKDNYFATNNNGLQITTFYNGTISNTTVSGNHFISNVQKGIVEGSNT